MRELRGTLRLVADISDSSFSGTGAGVISKENVNRASANSVIILLLGLIIITSQLCLFAPKIQGMQICLNSLLNVGSDAPERLTSKAEGLLSSGASNVQPQSKKYKTTLRELGFRNA